MPKNKGIAAVKRKHEKYTKKTVATKVIITLLALILTLNNFIFNSKFYLQIKGCAMGTIYANIFMSQFEERYIYPLIKKNPAAIFALSTIFL